MNIDHFLSDAVFYPCSGVDGTPVRFLGNKGFSNYLYVDYSIEREKLEEEIRESGFRGYRCIRTDDIPEQQVFGADWEDITRIHDNTISKLHFELSDPFVAMADFELLPDFGKEHGPLNFSIMCVRCEAITTFISVFSRRRLSPRCVAYILPGIHFGGNFSDFKDHFGDAVRANREGLPKYLLYDHESGNPEDIDYLNLVEDYEPIERWDYRTEHNGMGNVTFAVLSSMNAEYDVSSE